MLIVEIILTIKAWQKGWKGWALLPIGSAIALGFLMGMVVGMNGGSSDDLFAMGFVVELVVIGVLIAMAVRAPRGIKKPFEPAHKHESIRADEEIPSIPAQT